MPKWHRLCFSPKTMFIRASYKDPSDWSHNTPKFSYRLFHRICRFDSLLYSDLLNVLTKSFQKVSSVFQISLQAISRMSCVHLSVQIATTSRIDHEQYALQTHKFAVASNAVILMPIHLHTAASLHIPLPTKPERIFQILNSPMLLLLNMILRRTGGNTYCMGYQRYRKRPKVENGLSKEPPTEVLYSSVRYQSSTVKCIILS